MASWPRALRLAQRFDVVYLNSTVCGRLLPALRGVRSVLHVHDIVDRVPAPLGPGRRRAGRLPGRRRPPRRPRRPRRLLPGRARPAGGRRARGPTATAPRSRGRLRRAHRAAQGRARPHRRGAGHPRRLARRRGRDRRRRPVGRLPRLPRAGARRAATSSTCPGTTTRPASCATSTCSSRPRTRSPSARSSARRWRSARRSSPPASGGLAEVVDDGVTGLLVEPGEPDALAAAVLDVLERRDAMSAAARQAAQRFGADAYADRVEALIRP